MPRCSLLWLTLLLTAPLIAACERPSVLVVGLDGAAWDVMDPLMEAGYLPMLRELVETGARGEFDCAPAAPAIACYCPPVWTSLATGVLFTEHGIGQVGQPPSDRRVKAIWSVLHDYGGSSTAVAMRATWPPDPDVDYVLTLPGLAFAASEILTPWPADLPPSTLLEDLRTRPPGLLESPELLPHTGERPDVYEPIARDRVAMEALRRLLAVTRTDLTVLLLHSPDKVEHLLWATLQPAPGAPIDEAKLLRFAAAWDGPHVGPAPFSWGTVAAPYLEIDAWLSALLHEVRFDYVVLVSDHGMTRNAYPGLSGDHGPLSPDAHRGILAFHGPGVRRGVDIGTAEVTDFAPTLAYLLDLPVADDLPGRVLDEVFLPERLEARPRLRVPSWEQPPWLRLLDLLGLHGDALVAGADGAGRDGEGG